MTPWPAHPTSGWPPSGRRRPLRWSRDAGRAVDLVPAVANSDGLLEAFPASPCRVLLAQADRAGDQLAAGLRAAGHDVVAVEAYATRPLPPDAAATRGPRSAPMPSCWRAVRRSRRGRVRPTNRHRRPVSGRDRGDRHDRTTAPPRSPRRHGLVVAAVATCPRRRCDRRCRGDGAGRTMTSMAEFPVSRLRRLRTTPALRDLVAETNVRTADLIAPLFVREGIDEPVPIASLPGVVQHTQGESAQGGGRARRPRRQGDRPVRRAGAQGSCRFGRLRPRRHRPTRPRRPARRRRATRSC